MQNEYLMHFNPFHDPKNGQFTSGGNGTSRREAKKYQKALNAASKNVYKEEVNWSRALHKYNIAADKRGSVPRYSKKDIKYADQMYKYNDIINGRRYHNTRKMVDRILKEAREKGYTIESKEVIKDAAKGEKLVGFALGGLIGARIAYNSVGGSIVNDISTTKYKVRK